jgi:hypothetical protein
MSTSQVSRSPADEVVFLTGRPPMSEFLNFVSTQTINGQSSDQRVLANEWRTANDHIHDLETREAGIADGAEIGEIESALEPLAAQVVADPFFRRGYSVLPTSLGVVNLDTLVVFQKFINLGYSSTLQDSLGTSPDAEAVFRFCLPFDHPQPQVRSGRIAANSFVFYSPSTDFRFLEATLLSADQIPGYSAPGPLSGVVALMVGFGSNFLNVVQVENRLILNNGSHRAYALRNHGLTRAPCIIQHVSRREELEYVGSPDLQEHPDSYLRASRPPLLKDYFDPMLRQVLMVPRRSRQVKISFGVEVLDVPIS